MFRNREDAGRRLAAKVCQTLSVERTINRVPTLVVGLPRGGVPLAKEVAETIGAPLTVLVSKKIGAPYQPELAIGAVSSAGVVVLNQYLWDARLEPYIEQERSRLIEATRNLEQYWLAKAGLPLTTDFHGKRVILVDDGIATGMTTLAAIRSVRQLGAEEVILAAPVIAPDTKRKLDRECDLVVAILVPEHLGAVGQFYLDFHQVEDAEVIDTLKSFRNKSLASNTTQ